jgi:xanthine dehydrogenase accessory factor
MSDADRAAGSAWYPPPRTPYIYVSPAQYYAGGNANRVAIAYSARMNSAHEFPRLYAAVRALEQACFAQPAALATITHTAGSTFRHAGSSMLIHADGSVVCALSGGCPQHDIVQRAQRVIASGQAELARYNRDSGLDVLIEMGCGGELDVLIEPLTGEADTRFMHSIAQLHEGREPGFMATALVAANTMARPRRLVQGRAVLWNDLDDAALVQLAQQHAQSGDDLARLHRSGDATGTQILVEPLRPPQALILVGINAVALALAQLAGALGWRCILVEHRANVPLPEQLPEGASAIEVSAAQLLGQIPCDAGCAAVVMTFNLEHDLRYLGALASARLGYLGAIGSRERSARMHDALRESGARLFAPAGLDLGAENPHEIALAIAAEVLAQRHLRSARSLSKRADTASP